MSVETTTPAAPRSERPVMSAVLDAPLVGSFTVTFAPGQHLPTHANPSRIVISAVRGSGTIALLSDPGRQLVEGDFVQLASNEPHSVTAGDEGLELLVTPIENCCRMC